MIIVCNFFYLTHFRSLGQKSKKKFVWFFGGNENKKICFEIFWPLLLQITKPNRPKSLNYCSKHFTKISLIQSHSDHEHYFFRQIISILRLKNHDQIKRQPELFCSTFFFLQFLDVLKIPGQSSIFHLSANIW